MSSDAAQTGTTALPRLGRYQLLAKLGEGGMGEVYLARDTQLDREVALKLLPPKSINDPEAVARFQREAKAMAQLSHPNIVQAYDAGEEDGKHFLVMEHVEGVSVDKLLREKGRLSSTQAADYGYQAAQALQHAHEKGLIHRDLKPSNLLATDKGVVKLLDLGLARFLQDQIADPAETREGTGMGTPDYASPEQFRDAHVADERSDVYSLGCTLYHLLSGRVPFPGSSFREKYEAHAKQEPTPLEELCPDAPGLLAVTVQKMMAKRPADRFQTAAEVAEALSPHVAGSSPSFQAIRETASWYLDGRTTKDWRSRSRKLPWAVSGIAVVAMLVLFLGLVTPGWFRANVGNPSNNEVVQGTDDGKLPGGNVKKTGKKTQPPKKKVTVDPNVLTVTQKPEDGGEFRTITEALAKVKPGQTIRVLDEAVYNEGVVIRNSAQHEGIILEAPRRATIAFPAPAKFGIVIISMPRVVIRGFQIRAERPNTFCIGVGGICPGVELEDLQCRTDQLQTVGVSCEGARGQASTPVVIRRCTLEGCGTGIQLLGMHVRDRRANACEAVLLQDNVIRNGAVGIWLIGLLRDVHVVGNSISGAAEAEIRCSELLPESGRILLANNSLKTTTRGIEINNPPPDCKNLAIRNNLILAERGLDLAFVGKDRSILASQIANNWRQVSRPKPGSSDAKDWLESAQDKIVEKLPVVSTDPANANFLRPAQDSPLADKGAGRVEPSLPFYVGALPPQGVEPWDWERTWLAPPGTTNLLTVSQDEKDGGKYRTINTALRDAKAWDTIRVLDDAKYEESINLSDAKKHTGIWIAAPNGAKLVPPVAKPRGVVISNVPHVRLSGLQFESLVEITGYVVVTGDAHGVELIDLQFKSHRGTFAVSIQNVIVKPGQRPVQVAGCRILQTRADQLGYGIKIAGNSDAGGAHGILIRDNQIAGAMRGVFLSGQVSQVHVNGNHLWGGKYAGIQIEDLHSSSAQILIANNTAWRSESALRVWDNPPDDALQAGQVEISNNLFFAANRFDVGFVRSLGARGEAPGDVKEMARLWTLRHNRRDFSGDLSSVAALPKSKTDALLSITDMVSTDPKKISDVRPKSGSPLCEEGAGGDLPTYVGALPPKGAKRWDWMRTWRSRMKRAIADK